MRRHLYETVRVAAACLLLSLLAQPLLAQRANTPANRAIPRLSDGHISFAPPAGEKGVWDRGDYRAIIPETEEQTALRDRGGNQRGDDSELKPTFSQVPFQPWAKELYLWRQLHEIEPYGRCKPTGGFRNMAIPYGTDIVQDVEQKRMYIFHTGGSHDFRTIYMDGREHPKDWDPTYSGHSVGRWEGDVLVIDTVGFNERGWIDARGVPTTKQLHLTERIKRLDFETPSYELIIDDPGAYTATWKTGWYIRFTPGVESFEFICQDNNKADEMMVGTMGEVDRTSPFVP
jgi:hypothetical protein